MIPSDKFPLGPSCPHRSAIVRLAPPSDGSLHSGWNLASLEVMDKSSGIKGTYSYNAWLPIEGGSATVNETNSIQALKAFTIRATTSDQRDGDFDGKVFVQLNGYNGTTNEIPLTLDGRNTASFKRGQTSEFSVKAQDVGYIYAINVRMEPSAADPEWCLDTIEVVVYDDSGSSSETHSFSYGKRLNTDNPSAYIYRTNPLVDYQVKVFTMDQVDAGFDGELSIRIEGMNGVTETFVLIPDDASATYSPPFTGSDYLEVKAKAADVGTMTKLYVSAAATGKQTKWFADKIEITGPSSSSTFLYRDWVTAGADEVTMKKDMPQLDWKVVVVTGTDDSASFDGSVYLTMNGTNGQSDEVKLDQSLLAPSSDSSAGIFSKGVSSTFLIKSGDVGLISYATIRIEKKDVEGASTTWSLDRVEIINASNNATVILPFKSSLNMDYNSVANISPQSTYVFKALIYTSDVADADFNGSVFITPKNWWTTVRDPSEYNSSE